MAEDALIPLSALQHWLFCPRQCALIHVEQLWAEDVATAEGRLLHERVDAGHGETRPGIRVARGVQLRSLALGVSGKADAIELRGQPPVPFPVEYKRGTPKPHRADEVQLCAQAICLEEAFGSDVPEGALFYGKTRRRLNVRFDAGLRALTAEIAAAARAALLGGITPPPVVQPGCRQHHLRHERERLAAQGRREPRGRGRGRRAGPRAAAHARIAPDVDTLRGLEGEGAALYFGVFDGLIRPAGEAFRFRTRSRRPPLDRVNALLSFLYAMLGHDCRSALETHGLDPQVGFLHRDRPGRAGLALDIMEELRPVLADRLALSLINRGQVAADDFVVEEAGAVRLIDAARKRVLISWQERKRDELTHPFLDERIPFGLVAHVQAQLLARTLRGDLDGYPPFVWREAMLMLVTYDVNVETTEGRRRLRRVARACLDFGQRVQNSVFECEIDPAQWVDLRARLIGEIDPSRDSLRFYRLGADGRRRVEHVGAKATLDLEGPLISSLLRTLSDHLSRGRFARLPRRSLT